VVWPKPQSAGLGRLGEDERLSRGRCRRRGERLCQAFTAGGVAISSGGRVICCASCVSRFGLLAGWLCQRAPQKNPKPTVATMKVNISELEIFWWMIGSGAFTFGFLFSEAPVVQFLCRSAARRREEFVSVLANLLEAVSFPKMAFRLTSLPEQDRLTESHG